MEDPKFKLGYPSKKKTWLKWKLTKNEPILYLSGFLKAKSNVAELKCLFQHVIMEFNLNARSLLPLLCDSGLKFIGGTHKNLTWIGKQVLHSSV